MAENKFFDYSDTTRKWSAKWIWDESEDRNSWMNFRKKITLDAVPEKVIAYVSAESRYWLYVNGTNVVFEGSLKRGLNVNDGFFDEIDITHYLKNGENTLYILAWYWGNVRRNFSSFMADKPGLIFEADFGSFKLVSDKSWKCTRNIAYLDDTGTVDGILEEAQPTDNLPESNIYYDGRLDMGDLSSPDYDDTDWQNATELGTVPSKPWGELCRRCIPLWKDYGLKDYKNSKDYEGFTAKKDERIVLHTAYNCQMTPYIELESEVEGAKVNIYAINIVKSIKSAYITRKGIQSFEGLSWFNGENVVYEIPKGVTIKKLMYRETGYNTELCGYFRSDDEFLNKLWLMSQRTLYITMRDGFMDCPDRERAQWWGDATNEMMMLLYSMDTESYKLYEKAWYNKIGVAKSTDETFLRTVVPSVNAVFELPPQELAGVCGLWEYYLYSGNKIAVKDIYPFIRDYLNLWSFDDYGNLIQRKGTWDWSDWGENIDAVPLQTAWYYLALCNTSKLARELGYNGDVTEYKERMQKIRKSFEAFKTTSGFKSSSQEFPDDRCNAVAVIADLDTFGMENTLKSLFNTTENSSPYMEKYVSDAMCKVNSMEEVQSRIKRRFNEMVNGPEACTTLWEHWVPVGGTKNHAWSGGSLITMSKNMAGIRPTLPAYANYEIAPNMGSLHHIEILVPTVKGDIVAEMDRKEDSFDISFSSPAGTVATLKAPVEKPRDVTVNGTELVKNGRIVTTLDGVTILSVGEITFASGKWTVNIRE